MFAWDRLLYRLYAHRLEKDLMRNRSLLPRHIGVILDGNRRWAKQVGAQSSQGHQMGADKILEFLDWSTELGIEVVTLWVLSTDNLRRSPVELEKLLEIICQAVERIAAKERWQLRLLGDLALLPDLVRERLEQAVKRSNPTDSVDTETNQTSTNSNHCTANRLTDTERTPAQKIKPLTVNIAVGYGGREEITAAVRSLLAQKAAEGYDLGQVAQTLEVSDITEHMYTRGQPDPDLVIRTSGEQRLSGFLLWQSAHSEFYFCEAYWPDFRKIDFFRALRDYRLRERRLGK